MSSSASTELQKIQQLALDICAVERNHRLPGLGRQESVADHSFSVALFCWRLLDILKPPLDTAKVFKYALAHDFGERGYTVDVNTYASADQRSQKKIAEAEEVRKLIDEFADFKDFTATIVEYEALQDEEALFVWSVDKLQAVILGGNVDGWWPYERVGITYAQFLEKMQEFIAKCSPYVREVFSGIVEESLKTYYDQPEVG